MRSVRISKNEINSKNISIDKTAYIQCNSINVGENVKIAEHVRLIGNHITIKDDVKIEASVNISAKDITIEEHSDIATRSDILVIEKFSLGKRSTLCECKIRGRNVAIGDDFYSSVQAKSVLEIGGGNSFFPESNLIIGNRCTIHGVYLNIAMPITIGSDVGISHGCKFYTHYFWNSIFDGHPQKFEGINIGDRSIIGAEVLFLPGTGIGERVVVGAGAVITKKFPDNCMIGGNPAKIIKKNYVKRVTVKTKSELIKHTLRQYQDLLRTKGFEIEKINEFKFRISRHRITTTIAFIEKNDHVAEYNNAILLATNDVPIQKCHTLINISEKTLKGKEDEITDDLRDFLRKTGVRIFTNRKFRSIKPETGF